MLSFHSRGIGFLSLFSIIFLFIFLSSAKADGLRTQERVDLASFAESVVSGQEGSLISDDEIIQKTDTLYQKAAASIDALFLEREKDLTQKLDESKALLEKGIESKLNLGKKKIKTWLRKQKNKVRARKIARKRTLKLRESLKAFRKKEILKLENNYDTASGLLKNDYDFAHGDATSDADLVYRYLDRDPLGDNFFATMSIETLTAQDASMMHALSIDTYRVSLDWRWVQRSPTSSLNWSGFDYIMKTTALEGIRVLPAFHSTASGFGSDWRELPTRTEAQRAGWRKFIEGAVKRYGSDGSFWRANPSITPLPITTWQIWNEANDYWFTQPVDPVRYTELLKSSASAIRAIDPRAKIMASSLFGPARDKAGESLSPETFLEGMHNAGASGSYDYLSLHPYSKNSEEMAKRLETFVDVSNKLGGAPLYITEVGWQSDSNTIFGTGSPEGQAAELRRAYAYILRHHRRLGIRMLSWFAWRDAPTTMNTCLACYGSGLLQAGSFEKKPAWFALAEMIRSAS